jgi:DNA-binding CsgD family transcriptional regulator
VNGLSTEGGPQSLSRREEEVLILCAKGLTDTKIAERLCISAFTVRNHIRRIRRKTDSLNRAHAVARAYELGILSPYSSKHGTVSATALSTVSNATDHQVSAVERTNFRFSKLLAEAATRDASGFLRVLEELAVEFDSHFSILTWIQVSPPGALFFSLSPVLGEKQLRQYDETYASLNPLLSFISASPSESFSVMDDFSKEPLFRESPYFREFCRPLRIERAVAWTTSPHRRWIGQILLGRAGSRPPVSPSLRELGAAILPRLRAAMHHLWERAWVKSGLSPSTEVDDDGLVEGKMLFDARGRFILGDDQAERIIASSSPLRLEDYVIAARRPADRSSAHAVSAEVAETKNFMPAKRVTLKSKGKQFTLEAQSREAPPIQLTPIDLSRAVVSIRVERPDR